MCEYTYNAWFSNEKMKNHSIPLQVIARKDGRILKEGNKEWVGTGGVGGKATGV